MRKYMFCCVLISGFILLTFQQGFSQKVSPIKITASNAAVYRDSLAKKIFGPLGFPYDLFPDTIITNVNSIDHYNGFPYSTIMYPAGNLDSIDKIVVSLGNNTIDFPAKSKVYLFHPHNSNGKLFIYHAGHCAGVATTEDILAINSSVAPGLVIPTLLAKGYTVLAVPMLYYKLSPPFGYSCGYNNHTALFTEGHYSNPLSFFFKPLVASLNLLGRSSFSDIYMCGLSGGGWTASIYPALDSSITYTFPVAGSWPIPVRNRFYPEGDMEQTYPPLFSQFLDYHELYTLACLAPARKMMQINNRYDNCCYGGPIAHIYYVDSVTNALSGTDGIYKFYLDETEAKHTISSKALQVMSAFIANEMGYLNTKPADTVQVGSNYFYDIKNNFSVMNGTTNNAALKYSLLKSPAWLSLNSVSGTLQGMVPASIVASPDTISFKVEDPDGRFVVHNFILIKKRIGPYFFTKYDDSSTLYFLPVYSRSVQIVNELATDLFHFTNPRISITSIGVENNSIIRLNLNKTVDSTDFIAYRSVSSPAAILYKNGSRMDDFGFTKINVDAVTKNYALAGMMRFNNETKKFEYFSGAMWIEMN